MLYLVPCALCLSLGFRARGCGVTLTAGSVMSESAATAWIIERLEIENTKMEEEMGNMDTCEEESAGGNSGATPLADVLWGSSSVFSHLHRQRFWRTQRLTWT